MNYPHKKLGDLFQISSGGTPSRKNIEYYENGTIPWVKTGDLHNKWLVAASENISEVGLSNSSAKLYPKGTVLLAMYGATIGACSILNIDAATNQACAAFTPTEEVEPEYLYYAFKANKHNFVRAGAGGAQPNISGKFLKSFEIPLPPLPIQKQIAAVLEKADNLRQQSQQMEEDLNSLAQSMFLDMFGDPIKNPKKWNRYQLASVTDRIIDCPHTTPKWTDTGVLCVRTSNLGKGEWLWGDTRFVDEKQFESRTSRSEVVEGDIILSREGTVGIAAIVNENMRLCLGQRLVQIRPDHNYLESDFLLYLLLFILKPERLTQVMAGSTVKHLNMKDIRALEVIVPPLEEQKNFEIKMRKLNQSRKQNKNQMSELSNYFNSLMQRAFKGELDLKDVA